MIHFISYQKEYVYKYPEWNIQLCTGKLIISPIGNQWNTTPILTDEKDEEEEKKLFDDQRYHVTKRAINDIKKLKCEILSNPFKDIKFYEDTWNELYGEVKVTMKEKTDKIKEMKSDNDECDQYNIPKNSIISLAHVIALTLYSDFTELCTIFRATYWNKKLTNSHKYVAHMGRLLKEAVQIYGTCMTEDDKVYHGATNEFVTLFKFH